MRNFLQRLIIAPRPWIGAFCALVPANILIVIGAIIYNRSFLNPSKYSILQECERDMPGYGLELSLYLAMFFLFLFLRNLLSESARHTEAFLASLIRRFSPWRWITFRYIAYEFAVYGGRIWRWLSSSWRPHLFGIIAFVALGIVWRAWAAHAGRTPDETNEKVRAGLVELVSALPNPLQVARRLQALGESGVTSGLLTRKPVPSLLGVAGEALSS